jgi:hypothetical protein
MCSKHHKVRPEKRVRHAIALHIFRYYRQSHCLYFTLCPTGAWNSRGFPIPSWIGSLLGDPKDLALDRDRRGTTNVILLSLTSCSQDRELRPPNHHSFPAIHDASFCAVAHIHSRCATSIALFDFYSRYRLSRDFTFPSTLHYFHRVLKESVFSRRVNIQSDGPQFACIIHRIYTRQSSGFNDKIFRSQDPRTNPTVVDGIEHS